MKQLKRHIDASCGCKMFFKDLGEQWETRIEWCENHQKLANVLKSIIDDFDLILDDVAENESKLTRRNHEKASD